MNEEYSYRPEFEYRDEYTAPPEEYGAQSKPVKSKKKKLAQLMLYSWVMLMIGGTAAAVSADSEQCAVTVYDTDGNVVIEQTVAADELETLAIPNGTYFISENGIELTVTDGRLSVEIPDDIPASEDGIKHIELHPAT